MRRVSVGFAAAATMAAMLVGAPSASAQERLAASCETPPTDLFVGPIVAQSFTPSQTGSLTRAEIFVSKAAGSVGDYVVEIRTADAFGDPEVVLASETVPDASVPEGDSTITVTFDPAPLVTVGNLYWVSVSREPDPVSVPVRFDNPCPGRLYFRSLSENWNSIVASDMIFRVFVTPVPPGTPLTCKGEAVTLLGTDNADEISGTRDGDVIAALGGNDTVRGLGDDDLICGGPGRDKLIGGSSDDDLFGQGGKDKLKGKRGFDRLRGGKGKDNCVGGTGNDTAKKCELEKSI